MTDLPIRRGGPADAAAIDALTQAAYAKWVPAIGRKPLPMTVDYAVAVVEHWIDLVEVDGQLVALVELAPADDHLLIVNLAVAPNRQGEGLGSRLLEHAEVVAREMGVRELRLYTNSRMTTNVALYGRRGYRLEREEPREPYGSALYMSKALPA